MMVLSGFIWFEHFKILSLDLFSDCVLNGFLRAHASMMNIFGLKLTKSQHLCQYFVVCIFLNSTIFIPKNKIPKTQHSVKQFHSSLLSVRKSLSAFRPQCSTQTGLLQTASLPLQLSHMFCLTCHYSLKYPLISPLFSPHYSPPPLQLAAW